MSGVQIDQKSFEMPPREGISIAHFLTVADVERSARYYEKVFGARILTKCSRPESHQQLYEFPGCGYSGVL
jgi:hypothetical protein